MRVNNGDMMRDAAIAGLGIALLPSFAAADAIAAGELTVIDIGRPAKDEFIFMAHPEGRRASAKLQGPGRQPAPGFRRSALLGFETREIVREARPLG